MTIWGNIFAESNVNVQSTNSGYWIDTDNDGIADLDPEHYFNSL